MHPSPRRRPRNLTVQVAALAITASIALPSTLTLASETRSVEGTVAARASQPAIPANYNARVDSAFQAKAGRAGMRPAASAKELAAERKLAAAVPQLSVERDEVSKLPVMVTVQTTGVRLTGASKAGAAPEGVARGFLQANRDLYGLSDADLAGLKARYVTSPAGGATIVKYDQFIGGVQVFDTELAVTMTKRNEIVGTSGRVYPGSETAASAKSQFALPFADAISRAAFDLTGRVTTPQQFEWVKDAEGDYKVFEFTPDRAAGDAKFFSEQIRARQVLFPIGAGELEPAYYLELWVSGEPSGSGPVFSYVISARDGSLLFRNSLKQFDGYQYRVFADTTSPYRPWDGPTGTVGTPHQTGDPTSTYQAPWVSPNLVTVESLLGPTDPWLPPAATATTGNNTDAYADLANPDGFGTGDVRGATSAPGVFDYTYNNNNPTSDATNRQAAIVGMFYQVNWLHDIWYQHGFTEAAGNAQTNNYSRGGLGNDSLKAEGQDRSGTDNANMSTPADGGRPKMQMYRFTAGNLLSPDRDGTFEMLIVGHEMGHYISNRLIGNGSGLGNNQGGSMGEGWGDFNCILTTAQPTDDLDGTYAVGGQTDLFAFGATFQQNYYFSIRRYPYSTRKDKSPFTFKDIGSGITTYPGVSGNPGLNLTSSPSEVHNAGEIWCTMLWEGYAALAKAYGQQAGHDKMMQYFIDGMKNTPSSPTFTQARKGVTMAADAANPIDAQILWQAFAKRGIGDDAVSPASTSGNNSGVVEDFTAETGLPDDSFGVVVNGVYYLQNVEASGQANLAYSFGAPGWTPLAGNWDGGTTIGTVSAETPGAYDPATGVFYLRNSHSAGVADFQFQYGPGANAGWVPLAGDWDGNGTDTIGLYNPANGVFYLRNSNSGGNADLQFQFGAPGLGWKPIVGDWDGNGTDTIGLYNPAIGVFYLRNTNDGGNADLQFQFGPGNSTWAPLAGNWDVNARDLGGNYLHKFDSIGLYDASTGVFYLRKTNTAGNADVQVGYGPTGATPVTGNFDGQ